MIKQRGKQSWLSYPQAQGSESFEIADLKTDPAEHESFDLAANWRQMCLTKSENAPREKSYVGDSFGHTFCVLLWSAWIHCCSTWLT